jgi:hypothetical protein
LNTAERIFSEVQALPEPQAQEVLDFVARIKARTQVRAEAQREAALQTLAKYRGRFEATKIKRDELYDRGLR